MITTETIHIEEVQHLIYRALGTIPNATKFEFDHRSTPGFKLYRFVSKQGGSGFIDIVVDISIPHRAFAVKAVVVTDESEDTYKFVPPIPIRRLDTLRKTNDLTVTRLLADIIFTYWILQHR